MNAFWIAVDTESDIDSPLGKYFLSHASLPGGTMKWTLFGEEKERAQFQSLDEAADLVRVMFQPSLILNRHEMQCHEAFVRVKEYCPGAFRICIVEATMGTIVRTVIIAKGLEKVQQKEDAYRAKIQTLQNQREGMKNAR